MTRDVANRAQQQTDSVSVSPAGPPRGNRLVQLAVIGGAVLLVAGPVVYFESPREIVRWYRAAAVELALDGQDEAAIERLSQAIAWDDSSPALFVQRARLKSDSGDWPGALQDCDRAAELPGGAALAAMTRTECLQNLGRHAEAIQLWRDLLAETSDASEPERALLLNGFAYACAVGNTDLFEALKAVGEATDLSVNEAAMLDPPGFLYFARLFRRAA